MQTADGTARARTVETHAGRGLREAEASGAGGGDAKTSSSSAWPPPQHRTRRPERQRARHRGAGRSDPRPARDGLYAPAAGGNWATHVRRLASARLGGSLAGSSSRPKQECDRSSARLSSSRSSPATGQTRHRQVAFRTAGPVGTTATTRWRPTRPFCPPPRWELRVFQMPGYSSAAPQRGPRSLEDDAGDLAEYPPR